MDGFPPRLSPSLLRPGVAHLFLARPEGLLAAAPAHLAWLSVEERERASRFRQPGQGAQYRATRVLLRGVLAGLLAQRPDALSFVLQAHGRPSLAPGTAALDFNASRSADWVTLVVTAGPACGVDVEDTTRQVDVLSIARAFAPQERALLEGAPEEERRRHFFQLWTLKEATLKALGTGLTLSLGACAFRLAPSTPPRVTFGRELGEADEGWFFHHWMPDSHHLVAVAVRSAPPLEVVLHQDEETCAAVAALG